MITVDHTKVITDHLQALMLHFDKLCCRVDDVIRAFVRRVSSERCVDDSRSDHRLIYQSRSDKACISDKDDETKQRQRLSDHLFLYASNVSSSFQFAVDLHTQDANLIKELFYNVANANSDLHIELFRISREMYKLVFDRPKDDFVTTFSRFTVSMHFLQNATIVRNIKVVCKYVDVIHEAQSDDST
jgi:hypothetical protein